MLTAAVITVSDKGFAKQREDLGGPLVKQLLEAEGYQVTYTVIIPDELDVIVQTLKLCTDEKHCDLVVTTGGTGFSKRDVTPEATLFVCDRMVPGIPEVMRMESYKITPKAMLSRATAGLRSESLIINLPGSPKAAKENLLAVLPTLAHGIEVLKGVTGECAKTE